MFRLRILLISTVTVVALAAPAASQDFRYFGPDEPPAVYPIASGIEGLTFVAQFSIAEFDDGATFPNGTLAFAMACGNDSSVVTPASVSAIGPLAQVGGGVGPEFFQTATESDGWSVQAIYSIMTPELIEFSPVPQGVIEVVYTGVPGALVGVAGVSESEIEFIDTFGSPPTPLVVIVEGLSIGATTLDGRLRFSGLDEVSFLRGDINQDGQLTVIDPILHLQWLFLGSAPPACLEAADFAANDETGVLSAILSLSHLFLSAAAPPAPYPLCEQTFPVQCTENANCL